MKQETKFKETEIGMIPEDRGVVESNQLEEVLTEKGTKNLNKTVWKI